MTAIKTGVKNSKMPKGVEHTIKSLSFRSRTGVKNSKMPKGVEHKQAFDDQQAKIDGEEFEDAERR